MKKKRILTLICAAAVVLASAPALPVFAETAESGSASSTFEKETEAGLEIGGETADGYTWYGFSAENIGTIKQVVEEDGGGAFTFTWTSVKNAYFTDGMYKDAAVSKDDLSEKTYQYAGKLTLGGSGCFGVRGYVNGKELNIVEGWDQVNPATLLEDDKLGVITVGNADYAVYLETRKQEGNKSVPVYWCIRLANQFDKTETGEVSGEIPIGEMLEMMKHYGVRATNCTGLTLFVDSGTSAAGTVSGKAVFTVNRFAKPGDNPSQQGTPGTQYFSESGKTDGYLWSRSQKGDGKSSLIRTGSDGCFIAEWTNIDKNREVLFRSGKDAGTLVGLDMISRLDGHYDVQANVKGDAFFGYHASLLVQDGEFNPVTDCYIVEGWGTQKPAAADTYKVGEIARGDDTPYDVYVIPVNADTKDQLPVQTGSNTVQIILIVRQESVIRANMNSVAHGDVDMSYALVQIRDIGVTLPEKAAVQAFDFFAQAWDESGQLTVNRNDTVFEWRQPQDTVALRETGVTEDGYAWVHYSDAGYLKSEMKTGKNGAFSAEWENIVNDTIFYAGKKFEDAKNWDAYTKLQYDYAAELHAEMSQYYACGGVYGWMLNGRNQIEFSIIDAWIGERPAYSEKIAEIEVDGVKYDIHKSDHLLGGTLIGTGDMLTVYRIIRQENLLTDESSGKFSNSVNVAAILKGCDEYGKTMGTLTEVSAFAEVWGGNKLNNKGTVEMTKNQLTYEVSGTAQQDPQPTVKGDANCDGTLDVSDAVLVARVVTEDKTAEITRQGMVNGDADGDSHLTGNDVTMLVRAIAKQITL